MIELNTIIAAVIVFFIAGSVKGIIGLGLPTVSLALLTAIIDLPSAMALMLLPSVVTNIWQAIVGGNFKDTLSRIWPFLLVAGGTVWLGALSLTRVDLSLLSAFLGVLLIVYALLSLSGFRLIIKSQYETWIGGLVGIVNGVLTGMTGSFVVPGVLYLQALNLKRDALIQAMGMLFTVSTLSLGISLQQNKLLVVEQGILSFSCLIPAIAGMMYGQRIRKRLSEKAFRRVFFFSLLILGFYILITKLGRYLSHIA